MKGGYTDNYYTQTSQNIRRNTVAENGTKPHRQAIGIMVSGEC